MAKKNKINSLRGKRLVTGDPNLVTMNEIHVKDSSNGVEIAERDKNGKLVNISMPSGGGDSPSQPSGKNIEYLDVSGIDIAGGGQKTGTLIALCYHMNGTHSTIGDFVCPIGQIYVLQTTNLTSVRYMAFDFSSKITLQGQTKSVRETFLAVGWTEAELDAIPRVTEEQFYSLD